MNYKSFRLAEVQLVLISHTTASALPSPHRSYSVQLPDGASVTSGETEAERKRLTMEIKLFNEAIRLLWLEKYGAKSERLSSGPDGAAGFGAWRDPPRGGGRGGVAGE